jgi:transposase
MTGDSHYIISEGVSKDMFIEYLKDLSLMNPTEFKIILVDNAGFHSTKDVELPDNIALLPIPPYSPELNPAERVWKEIKSKISMKVFDTLDILENKVIDITNSLGKKEIKSLTNYSYIKNTCSELFIA